MGMLNLEMDMQHKGELELRKEAPPTSEFIKFRAACGWGEISMETAEAALNSSLIDVSCWKNGTLIGFGRVVGDGVLYFYLQDIIVHPNWRKQAIGSKIIERLLSEIKKVAPNGATIGLMSATGKEELYEKFGFTARPTKGLGAGMTQFF